MDATAKPTIGATELTTRVLIDSLASDTCPACGGRKVPRQTLCRQHYYALPKTMRLALYDRVDSGYDAAVKAAFDFLEVSKFHQPTK